VLTWFKTHYHITNVNTDVVVIQDIYTKFKEDTESPYVNYNKSEKLVAYLNEISSPDDYLQFVTHAPRNVVHIILPPKIGQSERNKLTGFKHIILPGVPGSRTLFYIYSTTYIPTRLPRSGQNYVFMCNDLFRSDCPIGAGQFYGITHNPATFTHILAFHYIILHSLPLFFC